MSEKRRPGIEPEATTAVELVVITGLSGAGRSEAMHTFEDLGYFCVDNLPPSFLNQLADLASLPDSRLARLAVVCDVRGHELFGELAHALEGLHERGIVPQILFLEADEEVLLRRFKETRRRHPMCEEGGSLVDSIRVERAALEDLRAVADVIVDSSDLSSQAFREVIRQRFTESRSHSIAITVYSFGFKYSLPKDADLVMDVRFLPNPHYDLNLRPLSGLDSPVADYVMRHPQTATFLARWFDLLDTVVPGYVIEGKHHLSIAVGCTGGRHRSVAIAEATASHLSAIGYHVSIEHRDLDRDRQ